MAHSTPLIDRMATKFTVGDGCWEWTGGVDGQGYGQIHNSPGAAGPVMLKAHRALYETMVGPIPEGLELDHLCRNRRCIRPGHLEVVTHAENVRRGEAGKHHADKTHCAQGHAYDEANTYIRKDRKNRRECLACRREALVKSRANRKDKSRGLVK